MKTRIIHLSIQMKCIWKGSSATKLKYSEIFQNEIVLALIYFQSTVVMNPIGKVSLTYRAHAIRVAIAS